MPKGYAIKHQDKYEDYIYIGKNKIASIEINPDCDYSLKLSSIISNWIGMSTYIKNSVKETDFKSYKRYKALIAFEPSPAQKEKGDSLPMQLHYFYVKGKCLLDLSFDSNYKNEKNADFIANAIELK